MGNCASKLGIVMSEIVILADFLILDFGFLDFRIVILVVLIVC